MDNTAKQATGLGYSMYKVYRQYESIEECRKRFGDDLVDIFEPVMAEEQLEKGGDSID